MYKIGLVVTSLDGCITKHQDEGVNFSSKEDKQYFHEILKTFDCYLSGAITFESNRSTILKSLSPEHKRIVWTKNPIKYKNIEVEGSLEFRNEELPIIFDELTKEGKKRCAILGGASVFTSCIQNGLLDELWITLEPLGFGNGKHLFIGSVDFRFSLINIDKLSQDTILLKYKAQ